MPSKLTINESSDEPMPTEYGGRIETLYAGKTTGYASVRSIKEPDTKKEVPVVKGGKIERITKRPNQGKHWFYDDKDNPLQVRQWVYEVILGAATLVLLISFLVIVISSVHHGELDLQSFLGATGTFLGGIGIGYGYKAHRDKRRKMMLRR
jgi:hypothetical protein